MSATTNEAVALGRVAIIGVPSSVGARQTGQEQAPRALRHAGLLESLRSADLEVLDLGDLPEIAFRKDARNPKQQNLGLVCEVARRVADRVARALDERARPIVLGGDCTITIGVLAALVPRFPNLGLVYFDGDIDLNTPADSPSGIFDGMGMAHIIGEGARKLSRLGSRYPLMPQERIVLFGYNPESGWIDPAEGARLERSAMRRYPIAEIRGRTRESAKEALAALEEKTEQFLVHFDVDVMDHNEFPVADVPHKRGLSFRDTIEMLHVFIASPQFAGLVITEFNADRDVGGAFAQQLAEAVAAGLGKGCSHWSELAVPDGSR